MNTRIVAGLVCALILAAVPPSTATDQTTRKFQDPVCARYRVVLDQPHHNCLAPLTRSTDRVCVGCKGETLQHPIWAVEVQSKWGSAIWPDIWFDGTMDMQAWYDGTSIWITKSRYGHHGHRWCNSDHSALVSVEVYRCTGTYEYRQVQNPYPPYNCIHQRGIMSWGFWNVDAQFSGHLVSRSHYYWILVWPGGSAWTGLDHKYGGGAHEC